MDLDPLNGLSAIAVANARKSPWLPPLIDHFKKHNPTKTQTDVIALLAKYDDCEEDVYQGMEELYGERPKWPKGQPAKPLKLRMLSSQQPKRPTKASPTSLRKSRASIRSLNKPERRLSPDGLPVTREEFFEIGGNDHTWAFAPPENTFRRDDLGNPLPRRSAVKLARAKHDPDGEPFLSANCPGCGSIIELLLDPAVLNYHVTLQELTLAHQQINSLQAALSNSNFNSAVPGSNIINQLPEHQLTTESNDKEIQRLQWMIRENQSRERIQNNRCNVLGMKVIDLTRQLQMKVDVGNEETTSDRIKINSTTQSLLETERQLANVTARLEVREAEVLELRNQLDRVKRDFDNSQQIPCPVNIKFETRVKAKKVPSRTTAAKAPPPPPSDVSEPMLTPSIPIATTELRKIRTAPSIGVKMDVIRIQRPDTPLTTVGSSAVATPTVYKSLAVGYQTLPEANIREPTPAATATPAEGSLECALSRAAPSTVARMKRKGGMETKT